MLYICAGPKQVQAKKFDVYLKYLVRELQQLWDGVRMYDGLSDSWFTLHGVLMWTIHDYPGIDLYALTYVESN